MVVAGSCVVALRGPEPRTASGLRTRLAPSIGHGPTTLVCHDVAWFTVLLFVDAALQDGARLDVDVRSAHDAYRHIDPTCCTVTDDMHNSCTRA
jgi:hypothetical protein